MQICTDVLIEPQMDLEVLISDKWQYADIQMFLIDRDTNF